MITPAGAADESIMSSFLMNSGPYGGTDPKFLSSAEDYSQASAASAGNNYMATQDYYAQQAAAAAAHSYPGGYSMAASMGLNNHHQAAAGLTYPGREHMSAYGYGYGHNSMTHQQMIQQQMMAQAGHLSPLNHSGTHLSGGARSPVASPQPQNNMGSNVPNMGGNGGHDGNGNSLCGASGGNGGSNDGDGYPSPSHPGVVSQPQLTPGGGGGGDGMSSDCSDDESSPSSGRQMPVVYPWMKKIHVGGVGKRLSMLSIRNPTRLVPSDKL